jgi:hypothetical protein
MVVYAPPLRVDCRVLAGPGQAEARKALVVGLLVILVPMFLRRPTRAIARGCLLCGAAFLTVLTDFVDLTVIDHGRTDIVDVIVGAVTGLVLLLAAAIAWAMPRQGASGDASQAPRPY